MIAINYQPSTIDHQFSSVLKVIIYTKPGCPYCAKAKIWYGEQGIAFEERNAQDNREYRKEMFGFSDGDPTVPVIVIDGKLKQIGWEGRG